VPRALAVLVASVFAQACSPGPGFDADGSFSLLTYNVAGLPAGLSSSRPAELIPLISPQLDDFDLVLVQEDFSYQAELRADVTLPYQSFPKEPERLAIGDGLNRFSRFWFPAELERHRWEMCFGFDSNANDCLAEKGLSFARHRITPQTFVDVYNLHFDAGGSTGDHEARTDEVEQLLALIEERSATHAVIVAGDTNLHTGGEGDEDDEALLDRLLTGANLTDACVALDCPEPGRIDRVMYRSGDDITLQTHSWSVEERFVTEGGEPLSDHEAVSATIGWSRTDANGQ
jgi:hypothetical protein